MTVRPPPLGVWIAVLAIIALFLIIRVVLDMPDIALQ